MVQKVNYVLGEYWRSHRSEEDKNMKIKCFVTGATGLVGSYVKKPGS